MLIWPGEWCGAQRQEFDNKPGGGKSAFPILGKNSLKNKEFCDMVISETKVILLDKDEQQQEYLYWCVMNSHAILFCEKLKHTQNMTWLG